MIRGGESAAEAGTRRGRAKGTNQLNVAQHTARAVKIARVILFLLARATQSYSEPPPGTKTRVAVERSTSLCSVRTRMLRISPFFFLLRGVSNFSQY